MSDMGIPSHAEWFMGLNPRLEDETFITDLRKREDAGPFINTVGAGEVHLRLNMLHKVHPPARPVMHARMRAHTSCCCHWACAHACLRTMRPA